MKWIGQNIYDLASKFRNIVDFSENVTFYQPVNGADPEISIGSSATERLRININYQGSASISAQGIGFKTFTESTTANDGKMTFSPDENYVLAIDDGGIDFQTGYGISINGADIITDSSGTATLSNIDALDATTEATIETAIDTLANLTSVGTIGTGVWEGTTIKTAYIGNDQVTEDKLADTLLAEIDANTAKNTNVTTNLSTTTSTTTVRVDSSDGTNATLPVATTSIGGVMSKAMFDEHTANNAKNTNVVGNLTASANGVRLEVATSNGSNVNLPVATNSAWGIMSDDLVTALEANTAKVTRHTLIDSDAFTGASSSNVASAESIKAYADTKVASDAQKQLTYYFMQADIDTTKTYIGLQEADAESTSSTNKNLPILAPFAGKLLKVFLRASGNLSGKTLTWRLETQAAGSTTLAAPTIVGTQSGAGCTNATMTTYDFTSSLDSGDNIIDAGDTVQLSVQSDGTTNNTKYYITCLWEWDLS